MKEKDFQREFGKWVVDQTLPTAVFELKICKGNAIPFNSVAEHQVEALSKAKHGFLYHKIADQPVSWGQDTKIRFTAKKPFDCFVVREVAAYVTIWFYTKGQRHGQRPIAMIDIDEWLAEIQRSERKSLTLKRAAEIAKICLF